MLQFLLTHTVYSLYLFLAFILIAPVKNLDQVCSRLIKNIPGYFLPAFPQNGRYYCVFVVFHSKFTVLLW